MAENKFKGKFSLGLKNMKDVGQNMKAAGNKMLSMAKSNEGEPGFEREEDDITQFEALQQNLRELHLAYANAEADKRSLQSERDELEARLMSVLSQNSAYEKAIADCRSSAEVERAENEALKRKMDAMEKGQALAKKNPA